MLMRARHGLAFAYYNMDGATGKGIRRPQGTESVSSRWFACMNTVRFGHLHCTELWLRVHFTSDSSWADHEIPFCYFMFASSIQAT